MVGHGRSWLAMAMAGRDGRPWPAMTRPAMTSHGQPWPAMASHGRPWQAMAGHGCVPDFGFGPNFSWSNFLASSIKILKAGGQLRENPLRLIDSHAHQLSEQSSPPARPLASHDPGHGWPKLFAVYEYSSRKFWAQFSDSLTQNCGAQFLVVNIGNRLSRLYSIFSFELICV